MFVEMPRRPRTHPRRVPGQDRSRATVRALLEATARVLIREGYDRASTNRIAQVAGVNIASLYQYFPSKEALVAAVFEQYLERVRLALTGALLRAEALPLMTAVEQLVRAFFSVHDADPALHRALLIHVPQVDRVNPMIALKLEVTQALVRLFERRRRELRSKNPALAAHLVVTCVDAIKQAAVLDDARVLRAAPFVNEVLALVSRYLAAEPPRPRRSAAGTHARPAPSQAARGSRKR
jgi:AcrR family transcriptional regulator